MCDIEGGRKLIFSFAQLVMTGPAAAERDIQDLEAADITSDREDGRIHTLKKYSLRYTKVFPPQTS